VARGPCTQPAQIGTNEGRRQRAGAVLTLLGLLLGFTFAMAVSRHDTRRELVVQEANSILTTARRAQLLPEPQATNVGRLLREYVTLRIEAHRETQFSQRFAALRKRFLCRNACRT